jgi:multicomponent Na+:H+ antiporter subunit C
MNLILSLLIGVLFACGFYLTMNRSTLRFVLGLLVLSQATNLFLFASGGITRASTPIIEHGSVALIAGPEPLTQALILTAIVISFAVTAFVVVLARQSYLKSGTDDPDELFRSEP